MDFDEQVFRVALNMLPGVGPVTAKKLVAFCGSAKQVFREQKKALLGVPHVVPAVVKAITDEKILFRAEEEVNFCAKNDVTILYYLDAKYPNRLKQCYDAPVVIYVQGNTDLSAAKTLGIIGTRKPTEYGMSLTEKLVSQFAGTNVLIVSGLAHGIDVCAHKAAVQNNLQTIGVLAHGLDHMYPAAHRGIAKKMKEHGGLLTDFPSRTIPDKENFPMRNRIVAGLCDAVVVVESGESGGSMITAEFANNYNRDVFAFPGRVGDPYSMGCHKLIKQHKAALIESAEDVMKFMGWDNEKKNAAIQQSSLALQLSEQELHIVEKMQGQGNVHIDELCTTTGFAMGKLSAMLLTMEFAGVVKSLPGKFYRLD